MSRLLLLVLTVFAFTYSSARADDEGFLVVESIEQMANVYKNTRQIWTVEQSKEQKGREESRDKREDATRPNELMKAIGPALLLCNYSLEINTNDEGTVAWTRNEFELPKEMHVFQTTMYKSKGIIQDKICKVYFPIVDQGIIALEKDVLVDFWLEKPLDLIFRTPNFSSLWTAISSGVADGTAKIVFPDSDNVVIEITLGSNLLYRCYAKRQPFWRIFKMDLFGSNQRLLSTTNVTYSDLNLHSSFPRIERIESVAFLQDPQYDIKTKTTMTLTDLSFDDKLIVAHQNNLFPPGAIVSDKIIDAVFTVENDATDKR